MKEKIRQSSKELSRRNSHCRSKASIVCVQSLPIIFEFEFRSLSDLKKLGNSFVHDLTKPEQMRGFFFFLLLCLRLINLDMRDEHTCGWKGKKKEEEEKGVLKRKSRGNKTRIEG